MSSSTEILIVGPGRLGRCMDRWLRAAGREVRLIGRGEPIPTAPITWLTVPDRSIVEVAAAIPPKTILLHASGAFELDPLEPHQRIGSLHPLMTFTGTENRDDLPAEIPAAIGGCPAAQEAAISIAQSIGMQPFFFDGDRRIYHAAAVLSGNFATVLFARAADLLSTQGFSSSEARTILGPLVTQSILNAIKAEPDQILTGPVARGDDKVIKNHLAAIDETAPEIRALYEILLTNAKDLLA